MRNRELSNGLIVLPMVYGVCRRLLHDEHAAEDALQATFLVLARKASSLRPSESLGPWLHEVALRTARRARADAARRHAREAKAVVPVAYEDTDDLVWRDLRPVLDDAIAALSDKYRVPFIRCYLEGETVAEVARQLGCPKGTIAVRLARAREQMRARLIRRGVSLSVSAFAAVLATSELSAALLGPELRRTVTSAASAAIHRSTEVVAFAHVTGFTKGVWMTMSKVKVKMTAFLLLSFSAATGGVALFEGPTPAEQCVSERKDGQVSSAPKAENKPDILKAEIKRIQKVYNVTDLVARQSPQPTPGLPPQAVVTREDKLIRLIVDSIAPQSWAGRNGVGTIDFYPLTNALVVNQTPDVQEQVADFLAFLHRLNDAADRRGGFIGTLIETEEGWAFLRRYVRATREDGNTTRK